jgi:hypothetical protein
MKHNVSRRLWRNSNPGQRPGLNDFEARLPEAQVAGVLMKYFYFSGEVFVEFFQ